MFHNSVNTLTLVYTLKMVTLMLCVFYAPQNPPGGYVEGSREPAQVRANDGLGEGGRSEDERKNSLTGGVLGSWNCQDFLTQPVQHEGSKGWRGPGFLD